MAGFKKLTAGNWTEPDPASQMFGRVSALAGPVQMREQDWARAFLAVDLAEQVPDEIRDLFVVARGALLYGWFFYPLFHLGEEQLFRVAESAAKHRYAAAGGPEKRPSFAAAIEWLANQGLIEEPRRQRWDAARHLRNRASHPARVSVMPPGQVLRSLEALALDLNQLFGLNRAGAGTPLEP